MKISVITVVRNGEQYIEEAIKNVFEQSYRNVEFIIVDGKSTDKTLEIIGTHKNKIDKIVSEKDGGVFEAMNKGIALATGDILVFHNVGDTFCNKDVLKKVASIFEREKVDSCYGDILYIENKVEGKIIRVWKAGRMTDRNVTLGWMPPHPTFFVKKEIYKKYGNFMTDLSISADYEIYLRFLVKHKISSFYLPEFLVKMRVGGISNSGIGVLFKSFRQDYMSLVRNWPDRRFRSFFTALFKKIRKLPQFFINKPNI